VTVTPLSPDAPVAPDAAIPALAPEPPAFARALERAFDAAARALERSDEASSAFAHGRGGITEMALERAQADVALTLASAVASRTTQALTTLLGMAL